VEYLWLSCLDREADVVQVIHAALAAHDMQPSHATVTFLVKVALY
jgi:hypothetical protein